MKKRGAIKGHRAVEDSSLNLSQIGQSFTLSGRGHGRKHRFSTGATNRAARRAAAAEKKRRIIMPKETTEERQAPLQKISLKKYFEHKEKERDE